MTSPAWTVMSYDSDDFTTYYFPHTKKHQAIKHDKLFGLQYPIWQYPEQRFSLLADLFEDTVPSKNVKFYIENYSFASRGMVFNIGESTGIAKNRMWKIIGETPETIASGSWKKAIGLKGNSKKKPIVDLFIDKTGIPLYDMFSMDPEQKNLGVLTDIADSWCIATVGKSMLSQKQKQEDN